MGGDGALALCCRFRPQPPCGPGFERTRPPPGAPPERRRGRHVRPGCAPRRPPWDARQVGPLPAHAATPRGADSADRGRQGPVLTDSRAPRLQAAGLEGPAARADGIGSSGLRAPGVNRPVQPSTAPSLRQDFRDAAAPREAVLNEAPRRPPRRTELESFPPALKASGRRTDLHVLSA